MTDLEQAHRELNRIQGIIDRHETHMFSLRGWLFAALAGVLAAYYTMSLDLSLVRIIVVTAALVLAFIYAELRHVILVDALVDRVKALEEMMADARGKGEGATGWYDGPKVNQVCGQAVRRLFPRLKMTLMLNLFFYFALVVAVVLLVWLLPARA